MDNDRQPLPDCWLWDNGLAMSRDEHDNDVLAGYMDGSREQAYECSALRADTRSKCAVHSPMPPTDAEE